MQSFVHLTVGCWKPTQTCSQESITYISSSVYWCLLHVYWYQPSSSKLAIMGIFRPCAMLSLSHVKLFVALWTVAHQALLSMVLQARILEWVTVPSSRGSSRPGDWTHVCLHCKENLYPLSHLGSPKCHIFPIYVHLLIHLKSSLNYL